MKEEKNIDSGIREKLEDFQVSPPPHIWDNVQGNLLGHKRRRRLAYVGWIAAAAVIVMAFIAGWYFNESSREEISAEIVEETFENVTKNPEDINQTEEKTIAEIPKNNEHETGNVESSDDIMLASAMQANSSDTERKNTENSELRRELTLFAKLESEEATIVDNKFPNAELAKRKEITSLAKLSAEDEMLVAENIKYIQSSSEKEGGWKMGMFVSPGYSSFNASHSETYAQNMTYSGNDGASNIGGGVSVQYKTRKRWIFESGLYYNQSGQESGNTVNFLAIKDDADYMFDAPERVPDLTSNVRVENQNLVMNGTAGVIEFKSTPKGTTLNKEFDTSGSLSADVMIPDGEFTQVFDFMEIPLFVRYRVIDSKFGLEFITGLNAGIVVGNNSFVNNQYGLQNVGETKDISTLNVSGTLGLGFNYAFGKHFSVALEPRYSHYLNSINTNSSVDFRPYRIGLYTGLTYEF